MAFNVIIKNHMLREMTSPGEMGMHPPSEKDDITGIYEGRVSVRKGIVTVSFKEPDGGECFIHFPKDDPKIITLSQRFGPVDDMMTMVLEEGRRHISINCVMGNNVEIATICNRLVNNLMTNGKLRLSYALELHGFRMEKISMSLEMHKMN